MTALILHGIEGYAGIHWQQWLHDELVKIGWTVIMPNLPDSNHPDRKIWLSVVQKLVRGIDLADLVIIGHSLAVPTALDFIEGLEKPMRALISISGFAVDYGVELNSYFLKEKDIDFGKVKKNLKQSIVIYGDNDPYVPQPVLKSLADNLITEPKIISGGGHLNTDADYTTFPLLLEMIKNQIR